MSLFFFLCDVVILQWSRCESVLQFQSPLLRKTSYSSVIFRPDAQRSASSLKTSPTNVFKSKAHIPADNRSLLFHHYVQGHNKMRAFTQGLLAVVSGPFPIIKMSHFWSMLRDISFTGKSLLIFKVYVIAIPNGFLLEY